MYKDTPVAVTSSEFSTAKSINSSLVNSPRALRRNGSASFAKNSSSLITGIAFSPVRVPLSPLYTHNRLGRVGCQNKYNLRCSLFVRQRLLHRRRALRYRLSYRPL